MSYFFNGDFEDFLASSKEHYTINSNKRNQELEYLILWLEDEALYTTKKYDQEYLDFIKRFKKIEITNHKKDTKLWCSKIYNKELQKKHNSKASTSAFAIENGMAHSKTKIISSREEVEEGYIYKEAFGVSGIGTWTFEQRPKQINFPLIKEPLLDRIFDFSTLVLEGKSITYQNHVDDNFQYKGTTLGINFTPFSWFEKYRLDVECIIKEFENIQGPWSIDSFLYREDGKDLVYTLSEINARKTMGYCTLKLKEILFSKERYTRLRLISNRKIKNEYSHEEIYNRFEGKIIPLSPKGNIFSLYLICEDNLGELNELEDFLFLTLFN